MYKGICDKLDGPLASSALQLLIEEIEIRCGFLYY